jgi:acylphosphatase
MTQQPASLRAVVHGRVQGVGFRDHIFTRARFLRLTGYVRNLPGGRSLEVVAEGPSDDLEQLLEFLDEGPGMAMVERVEVEWGEAGGGYDGFGVAS